MVKFLRHLELHINPVIENIESTSTDFADIARYSCAT